MKFASVFTAVSTIMAVSTTAVFGQTEQRMGSIRKNYQQTRAPPAGAGQMGGNWYDLSYAPYQHPENINVEGNHFTMTIKPGANNAKLSSKAFYTQGRFEIRMKTAAVMPGTVTAFYLASGDGRTGDESIGTQDELDFEIKGNTPNQVQTNVFMDGEEENQVTFMGDTAAEFHNYAFDWTPTSVKFEIDGNVVRTSRLHRPLKPMQMSLSIWTTYGLWAGVTEWAGVTDWNAVGNNPISAEFEVVSFPQ